MPSMSKTDDVQTRDLHMGPGWYMRRTSNATALAPFYVDGLGTSNIRGVEPVYFLWAGESFIIELKAEKPPRDERVTDPGVHPCTPVFHTRNLSQTLTRLLNAGGQLIGSEETPFGLEAFVLDPDQQILGLREPVGGERALGRAAVSDFNPGCTPLPDDLIGLRSIVRRVADMDVMTRFYGETIGFKDMGMVHGRRLFDLGEGVHLELAEGGELQKAPQDRVEITNHFIIRVTDHDAFNGALKDAGIQFSNDSFRWNSANMSICIDPEGHIMGFEERFEPHEYGHPRDPFAEDQEANRRWQRRTGSLHALDEDGFEVGYAATRFGALHYRRRYGSDTTKRPLVLLHPSPYSGGYFRTFMQACDGTRDVIAFDHIGYGSSAKTEDPLSTQEHAMAIGDALDELGYGVTRNGRVDVMGYHSGSVFAGELAILRPDAVAKVVIVTYPYYDPEKRAAHLESIKAQDWLDDDLASLDSMWNTNVVRRAGDIPLERGINNLVANLTPGASAWHGYHSVFTYAAEDRLGHIRQPTLVINTESVLKDPTAAAVKLMNDPEYLELMHMKLGIYELNAEELADTIQSFLDKPLALYVPLRA